MFAIIRAWRKLQPSLQRRRRPHLSLRIRTERCRSTPLKRKAETALDIWPAKSSAPDCVSWAGLFVGAEKLLLRVRWSGRRGFDSHRRQPGARCPCLGRLRMALDERAQFMFAFLALVHRDQGEPFVQLRRRGLGIAAETLQHRVVVADRRL